MVNNAKKITVVIGCLLGGGCTSSSISLNFADYYSTKNILERLAKAELIVANRKVDKGLITQEQGNEYLEGLCRTWASQSPQVCPKEYVARTSRAEDANDYRVKLTPYCQTEAVCSESGYLDLFPQASANDEYLMEQYPTCWFDISGGGRYDGIWSGASSHLLMLCPHGKPRPWPKPLTVKLESEPKGMAYFTP